ncbi:MAG: DUF5620 domain-containing protein [Oscillospiraceae bacterium]|nr:DUF5620 domain-containing protein [Oscillospiraceae bacterium]
MISRNMSNRMKAIAIAALMCLSATAMAVPSNIKTDSMGISASAASVNQKLAVGDSYKGMTGDVASDGIKTFTISITPDFTGNLSYGFGASTAESPYWYEWDGKSWVDTKGGTVEVPGVEVPVTAGQETTITVDASSLDLKYKDQYDSKYDGTFEFRNYYGGGITVNSVTANGSSTTTPPTTDPATPNPTNPSTPSNPGSSVGGGTTLTDDTKAKTNVYRGKTADLASSDIKNITITLDAGDYAGNFSYGFGIGIADKPYWMEYDGSKWVDTSDGSEVPGVNVTSAGGEVVIVIDTSSLKLKYKDEYNSEYDGEFEFRNYYSGGNTVTIKSIVANGNATPTPSNPDTPQPPEDEHPNAIKDGSTQNNKSGAWNFKDNQNGTGTMTATQARQIEFEKALLLTQGYDEETYAQQGVKPVEGVDPINSHKFSYSDFGLSNVGKSGTVIIESLMATIESEKSVKNFMYGGGLNVENGSPADTESAKKEAGVASDENAGYWYNDMGDEKKEECEAAGVNFGITPNNGYFLSSDSSQLGTYFSVFWDVPGEVKSYETAGEISFQYWYGVEEAEEYTEVDSVNLLGGVLTYTEEVTFDYTASKKSDVNKTIKAGDMSGELSFMSDLGLEANQDVKAVVFTVSATQDLDKLVYGVGASVGEDWEMWSPEDSKWDFVVLDTKSGDVEIAWIVPSGLDINEEYGNLQFGYWYGGKGEDVLDSVTLKSVEVFYNEVEEEIPDPTPEPTPEPTKPNLKVTLWGDANVDGVVDIIDVIRLNKSLLSQTTLDPQGFVNADVDEDGKTSFTDSLNIMKLIVELLEPSDFPIK